MRASGRSATTSLFYVDTLEYLRRGGRVGAAAALVGSALAVKPLLQIEDGRIVPLEKVRTSAKALVRLEELAVEAAGDGNVDVAVAHLAIPTRADDAGRAAARADPRHPRPRGLAGRRRDRRPRRPGHAGRRRVPPQLRLTLPLRAQHPTSSTGRSRSGAVHRPIATAVPAAAGRL